MRGRGKLLMHRRALDELGGIVSFEHGGVLIEETRRLYRKIPGEANPPSYEERGFDVHGTIAIRATI